DILRTPAPRAGGTIGYDRALMTTTNKGFPMRFMRLSRIVAIGLLFSLVLSACVPTTSVRSPAEIAAAQAQQGELDQAAQAYLDLATQFPGHSDSYQLLAAEAWRQEGQIVRAAP